jgi:hypothetical protein
MTVQPVRHLPQHISLLMHHQTRFAQQIMVLRRT